MNWTHLIIHHSASHDNKEGMDYDSVMKYHIESNNWSDIGYHAVVEMIENKAVVLLGRPLDKTGSHASGWNKKAVGICFLGNYEEYEVPKIMIDEAIKRFIKPITKIFDIPKVNIIGHKDTKATLCPGKHLYKQIDYIRSKV